jgi:enoyl-[acyl-carrier protein] reductase II
MRPFEGNRVVRDTGAQYPIFNAPIGHVARGRLVSAISAAGGLGLMEMVTTGIEETKAEFDLVKSSTTRPFGLHIYIKSLMSKPDREEPVLEWATDGRTKFMTTGGGNPLPYAARIREAGITQYHQVSTLETALKAEDAGVAGLIVEGGESGGIRPDDALHSFALLQAVRERVDLPIVAAGGIVDGRGMAAAFALGAEGILMGSRFMCSDESPIHANYKQAIVDSPDTLRIYYGRPGIAMRVARTEFSEKVARGEIDPAGNPYGGPAIQLYRDGRTDIVMAGAGETTSLIYGVKPVAEIINETVAGFWREIERLAGLLREPGPTRPQPAQASAP